MAAVCDSITPSIISLTNPPDTQSPVYLVRASSMAITSAGRSAGGSSR